MTIKRYRMEAQAEFGQNAWAVEVERPKGEWVRYTDHIAALRREPAAVEAPAQEPVAWKAVYTDILGNAGQPLLVEDKDEAEMMRSVSGWAVTPLYTTPPDHLALVAAAYRDAAERASRRWAARREHADKLFEMDYPEAKLDAKTVSAKADEAEMLASEISSRTPADAQDALTAIERAAWERGVKEAAATINRGGLHTSADYSDCILALLTQEGR